LKPVDRYRWWRKSRNVLSRQERRRWFWIGFVSAFDLSGHATRRLTRRALELREERTPGA
jgi:hypothetical protein